MTGRGPYHNRYSEVLPLLGRPIAFDRPEPPLFRVTDDGTLHPTTFKAVAGGAAVGLWEVGTLVVARGAADPVGRQLCVRSGDSTAALEGTPLVALTGGSGTLPWGTRRGCRFSSSSTTVRGIPPEDICR